MCHYENWQRHYTKVPELLSKYCSWDNLGSAGRVWLSKLNEIVSEQQRVTAPRRIPVLNDVGDFFESVQHGRKANR